jgi:guanine deaminase
MPQLHRGQVFHVSGAPRLSAATESLVHHEDGGLLVDAAGQIAWCGAWADRPATATAATVVDHHGAVVVPGFIDTHLHFPQMHCTDAYGGGQLLEWLERIVFPAEARFADATYARRSADDFCDRLAAAGTTTSLVFGSQFPHAQDALFESASSRGLRMVSGRTTMTVGPQSAAPLLTSDDTAVRLVRGEIDKWHPADRSSDGLVQVAVVPRFALSVTPTTLNALGEVIAEHASRGVYFSSHLCENNRGGDGEVAAVLRTFSVDSYLDVFDGRFLPGSRTGGASLLGRRSVLAHAVHCSDRELARLAETGAAIAHCPVSQLFLGSGTMPWQRTAAAGVTVAIGTDIGAGDEWFVPRVLNACFKVHHNAAGVAIHPAELLFSGTLAGARALDLEDRIGNFDVGKDADFVVIDPGSSPVLGSVLESRSRFDDPAQERDAVLFAVLMASEPSSVAAAYVRGRRLSQGTG